MSRDARLLRRRLAAVLAQTLLGPALVITAGAACSAQEQPAPPAANPVPAPADVDPAADDILTRLEVADRGLTAMQAEILLHRSFAIEGDDQTRWGMLYFRQADNPESSARPLRQFCVRFDQLQIDQRVEEKEQKFIFDGAWLAEVNPAEKHFSRKQIVAPGEDFDPLRVGEGPLPIPIGQRKADILARFTVQVVPEADGIEDGENPKQAAQWRKFVAGSTQLKLTPRGAAGDEDFTQIRLWYKPVQNQEGVENGRLVPRMSRTVNHAGDVTTVQLVDIHINPKIEAERFNTDPPAERGWDIVQAPFQRRSTAPPEAPKLKQEVQVLPADKPQAPAAPTAPGKSPELKPPPAPGPK